MKKTKIFLLVIVYSLVCLTGCEEPPITDVGMGIQPDQDNIMVFDTVISIFGKTVKIDSIHVNCVKSINGLLGKLSDPQYGEINADYVCQYDTSNASGSIDSIQLQIIYSGYFGNLSSSIKIGVYELKKHLEENYSNINPDDYKGNLLREYFVPNLNFSNSLDTIDISIPLNNKEAKNFLGTYISSSEVNCILNVKKTAIYTNNNASKVSLLDITEEFLQLYSESDKDKSLINQDSDSVMYLKTSTGIFSQITITLSEIKEGEKISNARLDIPVKLENFPYMGDMSDILPRKLLLIESDSVQSFFEKQVANGQTAFFSTFNSITQSYTYDNISNMVQNAIDKELQLLLVPVQVRHDIYEIDYTSSYYPIALKKDLKIEIVTVKK